MEELNELEQSITKRLHEIRNKEKKTLNELDEYQKLQKKLREVYNVQIYIQRMKEGK